MKIDTYKVKEEKGVTLMALSIIIIVLLILTSITVNIGKDGIKESKEDNDLLAAVGQMSLCFTEVIVFSFLTIASIFIGEKVFIIIFILSIISSIFININIKNSKDKF